MIDLALKTPPSNAVWRQAAYAPIRDGWRPKTSTVSAVGRDLCRTTANFSGSANCTIAADAEHDGAIKATAAGDSAYPTIKRAAAAPVDITGKFVRVRYYIHEGTAGQPDHWTNIAWIQFWLWSGAGYLAFTIYTGATATGGYWPGWHEAYVSQTNWGAPSGGENSSFNPADYRSFWVRFALDHATDTPAVTIDDVAFLDRRQTDYGLYCPIFEAGYSRQNDAAAALAAEGHAGSFAPSVGTVGTAGYLTWAQLRAIAADHFVYMYPRPLNDDDTADEPWQHTDDADKPTKVRYARRRLLAGNAARWPEALWVMSMPGQGAADGGSPPGVTGWNAWTQANILGPQVQLNVGGPTDDSGINRVRPLDHFTRSAPVGMYYSATSPHPGIAEAAGDPDTVFLENYHCYSDPQLNRFLADLAAALPYVAAGTLRIVTLRDIATGNV